VALPLIRVGSAGAHPFMLVALAAALDRLVGDPRGWLHPVVVMGLGIRSLRGLAERWAGDSPARLRVSGGAITLLLVGGSGLAGWALERLAWQAPGAMHPLGGALLLVALASGLAGRSLEQAVERVLALLPGSEESSGESLSPARRCLASIVGRDTDRLDRTGILRALAETASENAVDGLFAPLFWMLIGATLWRPAPALAPGPLALVWAFKAASTLDSMLGYRQGRLRWLGTAGARLDDLLTWLPCRLVAFSLPLVCGRGPGGCWLQGRQALADGRPDPSPNAGVSQAAYAHAVGVQLGGLNHYGGQSRAKPLLAAGQAEPDVAAVRQMLALSRRLELLWILIGASIGPAAGWFITKALS
jgi:adenosylcobinamide-phosphate synthase